MPTTFPQLLGKGMRALFTEPATVFRSLRRLLLPMRADYRRRFAMSLHRWLLYHQTDIVFGGCHWMGARAHKNPMDAWIYQEILWEVKPDVVVEIGSCYGGTTLYLAHMLDLIGKGTVVSVDIDRSKFSVSHPRIVEVTGDSGSPDTVARVTANCSGKSTLVIHDGDHRMGPVLRDLRAYSSLVSLGSYLIVEDGVMDLFRPGDGIGTFSPGPLVAIEAFLRERPEFAVDSRRERYVMTYNPRGFLRRVR
jgi:cephalosporin hydroxylase